MQRDSDLRQASRVAQSSQLDWVNDAQERGARVFWQAVTVRAPIRMTLEDWNLVDSSPAWKEATPGTNEERKAKLFKPELRAEMRAEWAGPIANGDIDGYRELMRSAYTTRVSRMVVRT